MICFPRTSNRYLDVSNFIWILRAGGRPNHAGPLYLGHGSADVIKTTDSYGRGYRLSTLPRVPRAIREISFRTPNQATRTGRDALHLPG